MPLRSSGTSMGSAELVLSQILMYETRLVCDIEPMLILDAILRYDSMSCKQYPFDPEILIETLCTLRRFMGINLLVFIAVLDKKLTLIQCQYFESKNCFINWDQNQIWTSTLGHSILLPVSTLGVDTQRKVK